MRIDDQLPYPLLSFPPRVYSAAFELMKISQVTDVLAGTSMLTALSVTVSGLADWKNPLSGQIRPSALSQAIAAISGDRKSAADELAGAPIYAHAKALLLAEESENKAYANAKSRWDSIKNGLLNRLSKVAGDSEARQEIESMLDEHDASEPVQMKSHRMIYQGATHATAFEALEGDGRAVALITDEGHTLLKSTVMQHYGFINQVWDGKPLLVYPRVKGGTVIVQYPRLTISLMAQPYVLTDFFSRRGEIVQQSGFCARILFSRSRSLQGHRKPKLSEPMVDLLPVHARMRELLISYQEMIAEDKVVRDVLEFDENAKVLWLRSAEAVETDLLPGYYLNDISDFGNKYMDIVGRIACLLHYFEANTVDLPNDPEARAMQIGKISEDTLARAQQIAAWHLNEYKQLFSPQMQRTEVDYDAERLYSYLFRHFHVRQIGETLKNYVRQHCGIKGAGRFDNALQFLQNLGAIGTRFERRGTSKKQTEIVMLNHQYFATYPIY